MKSNSAWTDALLASFENLTPSVREFRLRPEGGVLPHAAGSHLQLEVQIKGRPQIRSYSLVGEPDGQTYRIAVKRLPQGRGGSLAMWQLPVGARLRVSAPQNHFALDFNAPAYLLVAGGIGITPLLRMAHTLAQRSAASGRPVRMLYGARTADELAFLAELKQQLGERLRTVVGAAIDFAAEIAALPAGSQMYVCGPAPMLDAARSAWLAAGRPEADLRFETFGSSGASAPQAFRVQIPRHGLDITVPADCSLLEALEQAGIEQLYDCQRGECGLCALDVLALDGTIDHRDVFLSAHEKQQNTRLCACVSRVTGSITLDSAWRPEP
jgi:vanillate O-demethylase ferredoxin subunit